MYVVNDRARGGVEVDGRDEGARDPGVGRTAGPSDRHPRQPSARHMQARIQRISSGTYVSARYIITVSGKDCIDPFAVHISRPDFRAASSTPP
jgi:hypothetical protein